MTDTNASEHLLSEFERAHAASILDPSPALEPIPPLRRPKILVASVLRKPPEVLEHFFTALSTQQFRAPGAEVAFAFIANYAKTDPFRESALALLQQKEIPFREVEAPVGDYADTAQTRQWSQGAFGRMAALKNELIQVALNSNVDYLFLVDADVICDPFTIQTLLDSEAPIVSAVYWTNWQRALPGTTDFVHAGPQVWLRHPYHLDDLRYTEAEFREALTNRARIRVRGLGACTLISGEALHSGVNFSFVDALPPGPMSEGEDRHFCARAARLHIPLVADAWPDVYHAYHPAEYPDLPRAAQTLREWPHFERPTVGDLVNVKIEPLEPVADAFGRAFMVAPKWVRGRLGCLSVLPQIEEAVGGLSLGGSAVVHVAFPGHYPLAGLRAQTRLMRVTLLDCKGFRYAPGIERELFVGSASGRAIDTTQHSAAQVTEILARSTERT